MPLYLILWTFDLSSQGTTKRIAILAAKIASKKDHSDAKRLRSKGWYCESPTKNQRNKNHKNDNTLMPHYR